MAEHPDLADLGKQIKAVLAYAANTDDLIKCDDFRQESAGIMGAVGGAMAEQHRKELGRRIRRGLEGLARASKPTGGQAYGYISAADSGTADREIDPIQAHVVRRVFRDYVAGMSPQAICAALNREGVPSPGSSWQRSERRSRGWVVSCIAGDPKRGIGILNNEIYVGRIIRNRFRWVRSAADSSKRCSIQNPRSEWIERQDERLRIVPQDIGDRAKPRQADRRHRIGERIAQGIDASNAGRTIPRPRPRHLFSGLLQCEHWGALRSLRAGQLRLQQPRSRPGLHE